MKHFTNDHKDWKNQLKNGHNLCDKTGHPILSFTESQWKVRQQHDQNFPMEEKPVWNQYQRQNKYITSKEKDFESQSQGSE